MIKMIILASSVFYCCVHQDGGPEVCLYCFDHDEKTALDSCFCYFDLDDQAVDLSFIVLLKVIKLQFEVLFLRLRWSNCA